MTDSLEGDATVKRARGGTARASHRSPYAPPRLTTFGTLAAVTARVGPQGRNDGGAGGDKTTF